MYKSFQHTIEKEFEFTYKPAIRVGNYAHVTHACYTFVADVSVGISDKEFLFGPFGQHIEFSYFVTKYEIRKDRIGESGFDIVEWSLIAKDHNLEKEIFDKIIRSIGEEAVSRSNISWKY